MAMKKVQIVLFEPGKSANFVSFPLVDQFKYDIEKIFNKLLSAYQFIDCIRILNSKNEIVEVYPK